MNHKFKSGDTVIYSYGQYKFILSLQIPKIRYSDNENIWICTLIDDLSDPRIYIGPKENRQFYEEHMRPMSKLERVMK